MVFAENSDNKLIFPKRKTLARDLIILCLILSFHAILLGSYFIPIYTGVDPNGYHVAGKIFAEKGEFSFVPYDYASFVGRMWVITDEGRAYAKYPPFYPLLCGAAIRTFGDNSDFYINIYYSMISVFIIYLLSRYLGLGSWSLLSAFMLAINPVCNYYAIRQVSHPTSLFFILLAYTIFFASLKAGSFGCKMISFALALLSGIFAGFSTGIRYTDFLLAFPPFLLLLPSIKRKQFSVLAGYLLGLTLPWSILAIYHHFAFGAPWLTGYSLTGEQSGFSLSYMIENLRFYFIGIINSGLGPAAILSLFGFIFLSRRFDLKLAFFVLWIVPTGLLYSAYYWAPEQNYYGFLRFLLPCFIPCTLLAVFFLRELTRYFTENSFIRTSLIVSLVLIQSAWGIISFIENAEPEWKKRIRQEISIRFVLPHLKPDCVIIASNELLNIIDYEQKYILYTEEIFNQQKLKKLTERADIDEPAGLQKKRAQDLKENFVDIPSREYKEKIGELVAKHLRNGKKVFLITANNAKNIKSLSLSDKFKINILDSLTYELPRYKFLPTVKFKTLEKQKNKDNLSLAIFKIDE